MNSRTALAAPPYAIFEAPDAYTRVGVAALEGWSSWIGSDGEPDVLTDSEKTDARRFMGYPVFGISPSGNMGWQFYQAAGLAEYRLSNLTGSEEDVLRRYLSSLTALELSVPEAGAALDTAAAGEWKRNPHEVVERSKLFDDWRFRLCAFLGVPPGPGLSGGSSVRLIV